MSHISKLTFFKHNELFRFPNLAQELICNSALLAQALVEGGWTE
jgi:hypothetical protein